MLEQEASYILEKLPFCCSNKIVFFFWFFWENQLRCWMGISLSLLSITYVTQESQIEGMSYFHDKKDWLWSVFLWLRVYVLKYSSVSCMRGGEKKLPLSTVALVPRSPLSIQEAMELRAQVCESKHTKQKFRPQLQGYGGQRHSRMIPRTQRTAGSYGKGPLDLLAHFPHHTSFREVEKAAHRKCCQKHLTVCQDGNLYP